EGGSSGEQGRGGHTGEKTAQCNGHGTSPLDTRIYHEFAPTIGTERGRGLSDLGPMRVGRGRRDALWDQGPISPAAPATDNPPVVLVAGATKPVNHARSGYRPGMPGLERSDMKKMITMATVLFLAAAGAFAQASQTPPSAAASAADRTVDQTASPELVGQLVKDLGVTPAQAEGAAGALFGVAKTKLTAADFTKVASAVPNMDGLIKAAPAKDAKTGAMDALLGKTAASTGGVVAAAGALSKLGLKPETILKLTPSLVKAVETKGGAEVAGLLAGALK